MKQLNAKQTNKQTKKHQQKKQEQTHLNYIQQETKETVDVCSLG